MPCRAASKGFLTLSLSVSFSVSFSLSLSLFLSLSLSLAIRLSHPSLLAGLQDYILHLYRTVIDKFQFVVQSCSSV